MRSFLARFRRDDVTSTPRVFTVRPDLRFGPQPRPTDYAGLARDGVTHILNLRRSGADGPPSGAAGRFAYRNVPVPDRAPPSDEQFEEVLGWLEAERAAGESPALFIHCQAGVGRTPTLAIALLIEEGMGLGEALRSVHAASSDVAPTDEQLAWLGHREALVRDR